MYLKITLHSAAAEEIIKNYITFLDPGGINYVVIVWSTVFWIGHVSSCPEWYSFVVSMTSEFTSSALLAGGKVYPPPLSQFFAHEV